MGEVKKFLTTCELPERELHNSRMFIDLAENIHIHFREYRTVFSLDEYFEYADIILKSTEDVRNYLSQNPEYKESTYPDLLQIAGGRQRVKQFLKNSPAPNKSEYYNNNFAIELQDEKEVDEIHVHYRDFRIAMNRDTFRKFASEVNHAWYELIKFERSNKYVREKHSDHVAKIYEDNGNKNEETKFVVGRNKDENEMIKAIALPGDILLEAKDHVGPVSILRGKNAKVHIEFASAVTLRYSDAPKTEHAIVSIKNGDSTDEISSECAVEQSYLKFRM